MYATGHSSLPPVASYTLYLLGSALYFGFISSYFIIPRASSFSSSAPLVLGILLFFVSSYAFALTCVSDPGVIPRALKPLYGSERPPKTQRTLTTRGMVTLRYCDACNVFRPPGTEHCPACDRCVMGFDHHCPWVGNCVGERNYRAFFGFLAAVCAFEGVALAGCVAVLVIEFGEGKGWNVWTIGAVVTMVFTALLAMFTFGLCSMHVFLVCGDRTTYDIMRLTRDDRFGSAMSTRTRRVCGVKCIDRLFGRLGKSIFVEHSRRAKRDDEDDVETFAFTAPPQLAKDTSPQEFMRRGIALRDLNGEDIKVDEIERVRNVVVVDRPKPIEVMTAISASPDSNGSNKADIPSPYVVAVA